MRADRRSRAPQTPTRLNTYLRKAISNGHPREQALIHRWWHESHKARGCMVWEYHKETAKRFPLEGNEMVLCEAKISLDPELIGQALVYTRLARRAGGAVRETVIFAETGSRSLQEAAQELGLTVVIAPLDTQRPRWRARSKR